MYHHPVLGSVSKTALHLWIAGALLTVLGFAFGGGVLLVLLGSIITVAGIPFAIIAERKAKDD